MEQTAGGNPDELQRKAKQYLADAQKTTDQSLREELLKLCEEVLRETVAARQRVAEWRNLGINCDSSAV